MTDLSKPDSRELVKESGDVLSAARQFRVTSVVAYQDAGGRLQLIKGLAKKISEVFDPHIARAHAAHKALVTEKNTAMQPLTEAEGEYKRIMLRYQLEQEQIRRAEQAKLEEAARKEREKLEAQAAKAEAAGKAEKAAELKTRAETVATPVVATTIPQVSGISTRGTWKYEITDKMALAKAVVAGTVPLMALEVNTTFMGQQARSLKGELNYPGVRVFEEQGIASRSA